MISEPAIGEEFFGRTQEKAILKERAKAFSSGFRQNIAILGRPFIGKTSLIRDSLVYLSEEHIIPVYIEAQDEPFDFFVHRFIGSLLYQFRKARAGHPEKDDIKALIADSKKLLPKTTELIERIENFIKEKDVDKAYDILLDLPHSAGAESGQKFAVIIEEFDKLPGYKLNQPFSVLGKKLMAQRDCLYIIASSSVKQARYILAEKLQLLFGNFQVIELKEFDFASSRDFLLSRLEPYSVLDKHIKFLIGFMDGHPFYLDIISAKLRDLFARSKKRKANTAILQRAISEALFQPSGRLYQHFANIVYRHTSHRNGIDSLSVLLSLSGGCNKSNRLAGLFGVSQASVSAVLSELEDNGLIGKAGVFSRIEDSLLRFWLKNVCQKNRTGFASNSVYEENAFDSQIKRFSADFQKAIKEDMYEKVVGLFKAFKDDIVQIEQKRYRLAAFSDVAVRVIGERGPYIIGHAKGANWICQIREREVNEKHMQDFLKDTRPAKFKFHRKILIVLNTMDDNAKLLAKSCGIWVWNLSALNLLLDIYGKYKVIKY